MHSLLKSNCTIGFDSDVGITIRQVSPGFFTKYMKCIWWKLIEGKFNRCVWFVDWEWDELFDWESIVYPAIVYHVLSNIPEDIEYCLPKLDDWGNR